MDPKPELHNLNCIFPPVAVSPEDILGVGPEAQMYQQHFGGHPWPDVKPKYYIKHTDAFTMMDPASLRHFIAGFLVSAVTNENSNVGEQLVYFAGSEAFVGFCGTMNAQQTAVLLSVIDWLIADDYFSCLDHERYRTNKETLNQRDDA